MKPLSQEEIDILLEVRNRISDDEGFEGGAAGMMEIGDEGMEKTISKYNFKRPRLFSQDQMRLLNHVHEAFARDLSVYLSAQLRTIVDISLDAMDQVLYTEYVMSSAPPSVLYVVDVHDQEQQIVFELDPRLVIFMIEKLFGGPGEFLRRPREISQIERRIMSKVMTRAFRELEKAWDQIHPFKMSVASYESNAEFVQIIPGVEPALVGTFEVLIYEQRSFINICYPYILLDRIMGRSGISQWLSSSTSEVQPEVRQNYEHSLRSLNVDMRAIFGQTSLPITEVMRLQEGDVLPLTRRVTEPIDVYVEDKHAFSAKAGNSGSRRALQIMEVLQDPRTLI